MFPPLQTFAATAGQSGSTSGDLSGSYPGSMSAGLLTAAKLLFITWV
jgi:hypothetical protein